MTDEYMFRSGTIKELRMQLQEQEVLLSNHCKVLKEMHGQGPHMVDGQELFIYNNGETHFFAKRRGRIKKVVSVHPT